jgi:hypothetical protein
MWSSGDVVCLRQTWRGRVWQTHAWYVVEQTDNQLVLFAPVGAEAWFPGIPVPQDDWTLTRSPLQQHHLCVTRPDEHYSTLLIWHEDWTFEEWYVNFERPQQPTPLGFDYFDVALDLVCCADGRWEILDEDELEEGRRTGVFTEDDELQARADAARIVEEWPFPTGWEDWRPDPRWEPPSLPVGWDVVEP